MRKTLYLFRHGETDWNKDKIVQGVANIPLNENGIQQAKELAESLLTSGIQHVYTSDLDRAYKTGQIIAERLSIEAEKVDNLREISFGDFAGKPIKTLFEEIDENFYKNFSKTPEYDDFVFPNGNSKKVVRIRFVNCVKEILKNTKYNIIAIVAHGIVLKQFFYHYNNEYPDTMPNCSAMKCFYENGEIFDLTVEEINK